MPVNRRAEDLLASDLAEVLGRAPETEYRFHDSRQWRLDVAYPSIKLGIELDGYRYHSSRASQRNDFSKQNCLVEGGWRVLRYPAAEIFRNDVRRRIVDQTHRVACGVCDEDLNHCVIERVRD